MIFCYIGWLARFLFINSVHRNLGIRQRFTKKLGIRKEHKDRVGLWQGTKGGVSNDILLQTCYSLEPFWYLQPNVCAGDSFLSRFFNTVVHKGSNLTELSYCIYTHVYRWQYGLRSPMDQKVHVWLWLFIEQKCTSQSSGDFSTRWRLWKPFVRRNQQIVCPCSRVGWRISNPTSGIRASTGRLGLWNQPGGPCWWYRWPMLTPSQTIAKR